MNPLDTLSFKRHIEQIHLDEYQSSKWIHWSEQLWGQAETGWLKRDGQDHFYREIVVIPALLRAFDSLAKRPLSIVDLGCGDGHSASLLLAEFKRRRLSSSVTLVDRSQRLLSAASHDPNLASSCLVQADFTSSSWSQQLSQLQHPTLFLAIFLLQELFDLRLFFDGISELMLAEDRLLAVVPAPRYAEGLRRSSRLRLVVKGSSIDDWCWAGEYPISTPNGSLVLPHFQRTLDHYRRAACMRGLALISHEDLCVPHTIAAHNVFAKTVYGCEIIGRPSAKLLTFSSVGSSVRFLGRP